MAFTAGQKIRAADLNQPFGHAGLTSGFVNTNGGVYPTLAAQVLANGVTFTSNALVVPKAGLYVIIVKAYLSGSPGHLLDYSVALNTTANPPPSAVSGTPIGNGVLRKDVAEDLTHQLVGHTTLAANDAVRLFTKTSTSVNVWGTNGYNGTYLEVRRIQD